MLPQTAFQELLEKADADVAAYAADAAADAAAAARDNKRAEILKQCAEICRTRLQSPDFAE